MTKEVELETGRKTKVQTSEPIGDPILTARMVTPVNDFLRQSEAFLFEYLGWMYHKSELLEDGMESFFWKVPAQLPPE